MTPAKKISVNFIDYTSTAARCATCGGIAMKIDGPRRQCALGHEISGLAT